MFRHTFQLNWQFLIYSYIKQLIKYSQIELQFYHIMGAADVEIRSY